MQKTILIGGAAGLGSAVTSHLIGRIFCKMGYYVFNYRDYPSLIRGGHNFNILKISDQPIFSHQKNYDIILALDQKTIDIHRKNLNKKGFMAKAKSPQISENNILIGRLFKYFGVDKNIPLKVIEEQFGEKAEPIKRAIRQGYNLGETKENLEKIGKEKYFISGNEGIALGGIAAGLDMYFAYPMTPATSIFPFLAKKQLERNILAFQPENEIAVINAALGASFTGAKVMVASSGGGFALMTEALSLAGMAELPIVIYLSQRTAPSSGVPTHTAQGDLKFALNAGHGEFPRIVSAPGDSQEAIMRIQEAFYLSLKYRTPAIVLGDKHLAESNFSFKELKKSPLILKNKPVDKASSYEHREDYHTTEDPAEIVKSQNRRLKKKKYISQEIEKLIPVKVFGSGNNLIIGWGSTKGAIIDALPKLKNFRFLQISYLEPFPAEKVKREIQKSKKVILVENNATGLLADVIAEKTGYIIKNKILKYDARPFVPEDIIKKIKK